MFFVRVVNCLKGYVQMKAEGRFLERFINLCSNRQIYMWDIRRTGATCITAKISRQGFRCLRPICASTHTRVHILTKKGFPFILAKLLRRKLFLIGFFAFIIAIFWMCNHIWAIELSGTYYMEDYIILQELEKSGVKVGASIHSIDQNQVKNDILTRNSQLSFIWVDIRGTKAYVEVKQKDEKPEVVPSGVPCNIVAKHSGLIKKITVREGDTIAQENQYVQEGDLLVSGIRETKFIGMRLVRADADVQAETEHEITDQFSVRKMNNVKTGKHQVRYGLKLFGKEWDFFRKVPQYTHFEATITETQCKLFDNLYLPFGIKKIVYEETEPVETILSKEEAVKQAKEELNKRLETELIGATIIERNFEVRDIDQEIFEITLRVKCLEEIAKKVEIPS